MDYQILKTKIKNMKKLVYFVSFVLLVTSCKKEEVKDYVTLSGTIMNKNSELLVVRSQEYTKTIMVNEDGTFSDTLKVVTGVYNLFDGTENTPIYLKNGFDLEVSFDAKKFDESIKYAGVGAEPNNYLAARSLKQEAVFEDEAMFELEKTAFNQKLAGIKAGFTDILKNSQNLDSLFVNDELSGIEGFTNYLSQYYEEKQLLSAVLGKGSDSPKFVNYENFNGGKTSLDDLKGKYVYIDVWATWCGPCKAEIPFLKEVEKAYHGKNIEFVSISVDEAKNHEAWKKMVSDMQLGGVQLFADNDWRSDFIQAYKITGIPRFILIDPQGKIVAPDAPRPSSNELKTLFDSLSI